MANIQDSAMLVRLRTRQWSGTKSDPRIKAAAVAKHGVLSGAVRGGQKLLVGDRLERIQSEYSAASREHLARTLPWLDEGQRILSAAGYEPYVASIRGRKDRIDELVAEFGAWYEPEYAQGLPTARAELNGLFDWGDYPRPAELARRFVLELPVLPFPSAEDFRVDVGAAELARIRKGIEESTRAALDAAQADVWERIREHVGHMAERLRAYDPSGVKVVGKFHDTLVTNVRELVALLPSLNVGGMSRELADITAAMAATLTLPALVDVDGDKPGKVAADELRTNEALRRQVASAADAILTKMADFV